MTFQDAYDALLTRWDVPVEQIELTDEFGTTHVNACGPADGPPVVLLPGHGATSSVWFTVAPQLAEQYRVYAIDLIVDAGRSTNTGRTPKTPDDLHIWLSGALAGLGIDRAAFCGHSYGAWIALTYAIAHPERVDRLALLDPTDCYLGLRLPYILRALPGLLRPSQARSISFLRWETQGLPVDPQVLELAGLAAEQPSTPFVRTKRPTDDRLRAIAPLVFVAGRSKSQDPARLTRRVTTLSPAAAVVQLETATHHSLPSLHAEEVVAGLLTAWAHELPTE
ncbi:pimeloyl-ACP methyl ester carboxylesterase [Kribbella rubisoli]|uniref:Pimeloyl-ACP methyl ester carboxylesterase n=1 Tax=Kribbella rubisoli TaxID=3075929 RepID=A0A4Q7WQH6_9ACTN|nr:alpha/beta fold hydrolase [Kribbella rubisoli]RZU12148.1 pimeloyl-ACP methyl ester carboxylesterase [Kribbella rubisoli]